MSSNKKSIDQEIYDTYYSKKNKEVLPIVIFFSLLFIIFKGALFFELILWGWYISYCNENNKNLRNSQVNIKHREYLKRVKEYMEKGEI